jgi:hypothetical protein
MAVVPCLNYYNRSYRTPHDGTVIESGAGLALSFFADRSDADGYDYLSVPLDSVSPLLLGPSEFFASGAHCIYWADQRFRLSSGARAAD